MATVDAARRPRLGLLQAAVSLVALAGVAWWASRQRAPHVPLDPASLLKLAAALGVYAVGTLARAERWHRILERSGLARGRAESYRLTVVGYMGNNALPARAGEMMRVMLLGGPRRAVLGTIVAERLLDVAVLAAVFAAVVVERGLGFGPLPWVAAAAALVVLAFLALWRFTPRVHDWVRPAFGASRELLSAHGGGLLALSLAIWLLEASVYLLVGLAVGISLGVTGSLYVMTLANLSAVIPAAPGYVGTFDAAVLLALRSLHKPALGYLLVLRFVLFVPITLVGLTVFLARYARRRR